MNLYTRASEGEMHSDWQVKGHALQEAGDFSLTLQTLISTGMLGLKTNLYSCTILFNLLYKYYVNAVLLLIFFM